MMPNHVYNLVKICSYASSFEEDKELIQNVKSMFFNNENHVDFNLTIPQPENIFLGDLGDKETQMCINENRPTWYDWNKENWSTKWNAYNTEILEESEWKLTFRFQTAWNYPEPVMNKIINSLPNEVSIEIFSTDEGGWFSYRIFKESGEDCKKFEYEGETLEAFLSILQY